MPSKPHPTLEDVWKAARTAAPFVLLKMGIPPNNYHPDDLAGDLVAQFARRKTLVRYDPARSNLLTYVSVCMQRMLISRLRVKRPHYVGLGHCEPAADSSTPTPPEACEILLGYILNVVKDRTIRGGKPARVDGELYQPSVHSVLRLISLGYTYGDISRYLNLNHSLVCRLAKKEVAKVSGLKELL